MIGIFDSGYGGLTVLKACMKLLPQYDYLYLGDNLRVPYGSRSPETIQQFSEDALKYFFDKKTPLTVFACNTASAAALPYLQEKYLRKPGVIDRKVLGVIIPVAEKAAKMTRNKRIAVVGTRATIRSKAYEKELHKLDPSIRVFGVAAPLLTPLIEEGWHNKPEARSILKKYLAQVKDFAPDVLILGCTHYPIMHDVFEDIMGKSVLVLDSSTAVAESLADYLKRHPEIESQLGRNADAAQPGKRIFTCTDTPEQFSEFAEKFLGGEKVIATKVQL
ncbi:MAG: glutamate racemase [Candidatus Gracilibacteria bacterium]